MRISDWSSDVCSSDLVSEAEAMLFRERSGLDADRVHAVGNGIDTGYFDPAQPFEAVGRGDGPLAVFTGQMDYRPNIDAVRWFAADILPQVRGRHPTRSEEHTSELKSLMSISSAV